MKHNIQNECVFPVSVATYDVGASGDMRLSAILRYQQEAAEQHLGAGGLGWQALAKEGLAFVASRYRCRIHRLPRTGENLTLCTWHRERRGPRFFRCYRWQDADGQTIITGVMQFALVSTEDHRLLKGDEFDRFGLQSQPERTVDCADPKRYTLPDMQMVGEYTVGRSDIDMSHHMNNTRYADLMWDALPETAATRRIVELQCHFVSECRLGDTLTLHAADATDTAFVQVDSPRGTSFTAAVTTEPSP